MRVRIGLIIFINLLLLSRLSAQENITLKFRFLFNGKPMVFRDSSYITSQGDTVQIDMCKIYLSGFRLLQNQKEVYKENYSYHLINPLRNRDTIPLRGIKSKFDEVEFYIGVDSLTNTMGVMTGDLDPVFAMYWAWNSGYINAKIEGISNQCNTPQNRFEYHIGGYLAPYQSIQKVALPISGNEIHKHEMIINADLSKWFTDINLSTEPNITIPSAEAVKMAHHYAAMFSIAH